MKSTTSGTILLAGISFMSSSVLENKDHLFSEQELYALELKYNAPEFLKVRSDKYVSFAYDTVEYFYLKQSQEIGFLNLMQTFADEQIELDKEFVQALDALFYDKINSPSKLRF